MLHLLDMHRKIDILFSKVIYTSLRNGSDNVMIFWKFLKTKYLFTRTITLMTDIESSKVSNKKFLNNENLKLYINRYFQIA